MTSGRLYGVAVHSARSTVVMAVHELHRWDGKVFGKASQIVVDESADSERLGSDSVEDASTSGHSWTILAGSTPAASTIHSQS